MNFVQDVDDWLETITPEKTVPQGVAYAIGDGTAFFTGLNTTKFAKENNMAKAGAKAQKQANLPGELENQGIPEIDAAAGDLITANSERGTASKRCKDAGERLIKVMKKHEKDHYKVGGIEAWIDHGTEKAKAKIVGDEED